MRYLLLLFSLSSHLIQAQTAPALTALSNVTIIDANHRSGLPHQTILISGKKILKIFNDGASDMPDSCTVFNLSGKYVIPGLIDTHVHLATDPSGTDNRAATLDVLHRMLYSGITSVRDMAGDARTLAGLARDAITGDIIAPDIYYSALMAGPAFFTDPRTQASTAGLLAGQTPYMRAITDSTNLVWAVAEAKGTGATGIKLYADLDAPLVGKIVAEAKRQGMLVWGHAWLKPAKPTDMVKAGVSSISHAPLLIYDLLDSIPSSWKTSKHDTEYWNKAVTTRMLLFDLMKEHHTILDATLTTYQQWGQQDTTHLYSYELGKRLTAAAYRAGVAICAGTDDDQSAFVQEEMKLLVKDAGLSNIDALIAATLHGAQALGIEKDCGTIEVHKKADLVVLDGNPLEDISNTQLVHMVVKNGKVFKK